MTKTRKEIAPRKEIALSIDVEDYFHAANLAEVCPIRSWHQLPSRVEAATFKLLDLLDESQVKASFFVLGYSALNHPQIVKEIIKRGHELASHGFAHKIAYLQNQKQFSRDVTRSKKLLEDISGVEVIGYRAPNFSIREENLWAYDILAEAGYKYDSSLYPVYHDRYGNPHRSLKPEMRETNYGKLLILPLAVYQKNIFGKDLRIPVAGGAYWRIFPKLLIKSALKSIEKTCNDPIICYLHPWELDDAQPHFTSLALSKKLRHYTGIKKFPLTLKYLMRHFNFVPIKLVAKDFL